MCGCVKVVIYKRQGKASLLSKIITCFNQSNMILIHIESTLINQIFRGLEVFADLKCLYLYLKEQLPCYLPRDLTKIHVGYM